METSQSAFHDLRGVFWVALFSILTCATISGCGSKNKEADNQSSWKTFSSSAGNFSALFPGTPKEMTETKSTATGEIELHSFIVETDIQTAYGINYSDYPSTIDLSDPEKLFDRCQVAITGGKVTIMAQRAMKVADHSAREFEFQPGGLANYSGRVRLVLVGRRIYSITTIFLTANPHPADAAKFLDSFSPNQK